MSKPDNMPTMTTDKDGREVLVYPGGMVKDAKTGHLIQPDTRNKITVVTSPLLKQRRKELNQQAAEEGVIQALKENKNFREVSTGADATRVIAKVITRIVLSGKHDRDRIDAAEKAIRMADLLPRDNVIENQTNILNVDPETARAIVQLVQQLAEPEAITAEVKELPNGRNWV
jgi:hypothetical protein